MTLHLLLKLLFVAMFSMPSFLMIFLLCAVYLSCFMSDMILFSESFDM